MEFEERYLLSELMFLRQIGIAVVQSPSRVWLYATPWITALQASLTISQSLPKFMFIASVMPSSHLILWHPLLLLPSIFPSIRDFSKESAVCVRWPDHCSFSFSRVLLVPQFEGINSLVFHLLYSPVLTIVRDHWEDHSLDYMDLSWWSDVSLCFSTHLFAFLPRSNHLLISLLQSPSAVILEPKKRKSGTVSTFSPSICHEVMGLDVMMLVFFFII